MRAHFIVALAWAACGGAHPSSDAPGEHTPVVVTAVATTNRSASLKPESSVRPGANDSFLSPSLDVDLWKSRFEGESREVVAGRDEIVVAIGIKPGWAIADLGAGTGLYVEPFSRQVGPAGRVYAIEISPRFLEHLGDRRDTEGWTNVTVTAGADKSVSLEPESVDVVFVCDVYHHFEFPKTMLASIRQALKPGGQLVLVDFDRIEGVSRKWILDHMRAGKDVFKAEILAAGFDFVDEPEIKTLKENYMLRFRRR